MYVFGICERNATAHATHLVVRFICIGQTLYMIISYFLLTQLPMSYIWYSGSLPMWGV